MVVYPAAVGVERLSQRRRDGVARAVAHLKQPPARGSAAAGEPVAVALARERHAELLEPRDRVRGLGGQTPANAGSAVSCDEATMSDACWSGESSSPTAAWIPPWALAVLHDAFEPFVTCRTSAPERRPDQAAERPAPPAPTTSTSVVLPSSDTAQSVPRRPGAPGRPVRHQEPVNRVRTAAVSPLSRTDRSRLERRRGRVRGRRRSCSSART